MFVITKKKIDLSNWKRTKRLMLSVCYKREFVITEFVIAKFDCRLLLSFAN